MAGSLFPAEERKHVTVLFADAVGSTRMLGTLDPEHVRGRIAQFFQIAREEIHRYGGIVDKFIGDAVMAVFGLPSVHEEDPERAARAALSIKARTRTAVEAGVLPEIRIGINTGEVVANVQTTAAGGLLVIGEVVNLATRLQQHAVAGQVLVGERTMRAIRAVATLRPIPALHVKGLSALLPAWELLEIAPARGRPLAATPFVNRQEDLGLLRGAVRRALRDDHGHVVTILGAAGVGKSRLVQELRAGDQRLRILRGRALPYGTGVAFWPLAEAIREECGILIDDPLDAARRKLQDTTAALGIAEAAPVLSLITGLVQEGHELPREVLFASLRTLFQALARRTPLSLILEDLHAAEEVTLDFLEYAAEWIREIPLHLFLLSRPELLERRPAWMGGKRNAMTLFLDPLAGEASRELIDTILGGKRAPDPIVSLILGRAGGNPLFVEEMLRTLVERDVLADEGDRWTLKMPLTQVIIPDTVNAVIAARVDALPAEEKQALQAAAVVGKDFWLGALRRIADEHHIDETVRALVVREMVVKNPRSLLHDEEEYTFRNILIRDVAYAMIPKGQRWIKHARCAEWVAHIAGDRQAEHADLIAYHWQQVLTLRHDLGLPPDPRASERAIANYLLAGDRAAALYANATATDHYTKALALDPPVEQLLHVLLGRGGVSMLVGEYDKAREDFTVLRALACDEGDPKWKALALDRIGQSYRHQDRIDSALEYLGPALALSRHANDPSLTGRILNHMGSAYYSLIKTEETIQCLQEARHLLENSGDLAGLAESLHGLGETAMTLGQYRQCVEWSEESANYSDQAGNRALAGENRYMIAVSKLVLGEYAAARTAAERSVAELAEIGDSWNSAFALGAAARVAVATGDFGKALEYSIRGFELARRIGATRQVTLNLLMKGAVHREMEDFQQAWQVDQDAATFARGGGVGVYVMPLVLFALALDATALGRRDEAQTYLDEAGRFLASTPNRSDYRQQVTHARGRVLLALGKPAQARDAAVALSDLVDATGTLHWRGPAKLLLADAAAALRDAAAAAAAYRAAADDADHLGWRPGLWRALAGLADALSAQRQVGGAAAAAERAREVIYHLAGAVPVEGLRTTFLSSPRVQRVLAAAEA
jgi:class 3 adenylate cyclase/tetratricopeptide (TPR) repeat protein